MIINNYFYINFLSIILKKILFLRFLIVIGLSLFLYNPVFSQNPFQTNKYTYFKPDTTNNFPSDSGWNLLDLNQDSLDNIIKDEKVNIYDSHGWFPKPYNNIKAIGILFDGTDIFDQAKNIHSNSFLGDGLLFSSSRPISKSEMKINKAYSSNTYSDYPVTDFTSLGISFLFSGISPLIFRVDPQISWGEGLLFSQIKTKQFLARDGNLNSFKEIGILDLDEISLSCKIGVQIPFYGAFVKIDSMQTASYYYLGIQYNPTVAARSNATQYLQIINNEDKIRYNNGQDTLNLFRNKRINNLNSFRHYLDVSIGWQFIASKFGMDVNLVLAIPLSSVIDDADWKQYVFKFGFKFYYSKN